MYFIWFRYYAGAGTGALPVQQAHSTTAHDNVPGSGSAPPPPSQQAPPSSQSAPPASVLPHSLVSTLPSVSSGADSVP